MDEILNEDQQIEQIKGFFKKYGNQLVSGILVGAVAFSGYSFWQKKQQGSQQADAKKFEEVSQLASTLSLDASNQKALNEFMTKSNDLIESRPNGVYAVYSLLLQAKLAADKEDWVKAETLLSKIEQTSGVDSHLQNLAKYRLALVQFQLNKLDAALKTADSLTTTAFAPSANELKGDILLVQQKTADAQKAYQAAYDEIAKRKEPRPLLVVKMQNIGMSPTPIDVTKIINDE
ncbi:unnamed protein product [Rotaria magnacalcarata]|uniref:Ancillary SecYEG translocon subunit n=1 Tax=Rotaria magnacalcarata TaxID=392030 RepID=A0A819KP34_9BILA|nr:unnamed protein product [Rotaria magnacalcarata]CAF3952809.1 unnamed protein product [Rotaria magnacalcarata]